MNFHQSDPDRSEIALEDRLVLQAETLGWIGNQPHLQRHAAVMLEASDEIKRLRELIRRALAHGMGVSNESHYDLYGELATYLDGPS